MPRRTRSPARGRVGIMPFHAWKRISVGFNGEIGLGAPDGSPNSKKARYRRVRSEPRKVVSMLRKEIEVTSGWNGCCKLRAHSPDVTPVPYKA
jgi:hypothetical protein